MICYVSVVLTTVQLVMISFFNRANLFRWISLFAFCWKLCDICNQCKLTSGCCFGKVNAHAHFLIDLNIFIN